MAFKFSVIVPCHNGEEWIEACLRSVPAQTYPAHEVILIDDDSSDRSVERAKATGVVTQVIRTRVRNAAAARNMGIKAATGDWIAILDADDIWYPNHLQRVVELLEGSADVAFMACHDWVDLEGKVIPLPQGFRWPFDHPARGLSHQQFAAIMNRIHFGHSTVVYQADRLRAVGAFDPTQERRHDIDLWLRMIHNHTWTYDSTRSAGYRVDTPGSISKNLTSCEYFYLRSLLRNRDAYAGEEIDSMIRISARRGMGLAFVDEWPEFGPMRELAWPYLTPAYRGFYRLAALCPPPVRLAIRLKRRLFPTSVTPEPNP